MGNKHLISETETSDTEYCCGDTDAKIREGDVRRSNSYILRNSKNKGFTLVELIVVIVILAILAAILVPALLGYIDKAKEEQYILEAKNAMTATQSVLSEMYAKGIPASNLKDGTTYQEEICSLFGDTKLNDAYFAYIAIKCPDNSNKVDYSNKKAYIIKGAFYIYQLQAGDTYKILYSDGESWTKLEKEGTNMDGFNVCGATGTRQLIYFIYRDDYGTNYYTKYVHLK